MNKRLDSKETKNFTQYDIDTATNIVCELFLSSSLFIAFDTPLMWEWLRRHLKHAVFIFSPSITFMLKRNQVLDNKETELFTSHYIDASTNIACRLYHLGYHWYTSYM
jgi:hypothetical protein